MEQWRGGRVHSHFQGSLLFSTFQKHAKQRKDVFRVHQGHIKEWDDYFFPIKNKTQKSNIEEEKSVLLTNDSFQSFPLPPYSDLLMMQIPWCKHQPLKSPGTENISIWAHLNTGSFHVRTTNVPQWLTFLHHSHFKTAAIYYRKTILEVYFFREWSSKTQRAYLISYETSVPCSYSFTSIPPAG